MLAYQRYPLQMTHPGFQPAILSDDNQYGRGGNAPPGRPALYPPVVVNNEDQEEQHAAKGYRPAGDPNGAAFAQQQAAPVPPGYEGPEQYPKWQDGRVVRDPNLPPDDHNWPMWVTPPGKDGREVKNPAEYLEVMGHTWDSPAKHEPAKEPVADDAEMAEFLAWKAAKNKSALSEAVAAQDRLVAAKKDEIAELRSMADELGIEYDKRWGEKRLRAELEAATKPE